ncbi:hypothetical protein [Notoacmeibacter sp. MSK16QG-6]|uniref:hypothetical protein n=1 Tax=Notoacmeibacter sp. MSK16QG-6 TaxID=2957982 RepID=UPI00209D852D|nr:hypothetical protein [Notoacmeibacter sp. MSK16QG-6]MCP1200075.1 hypothetical protein [Notoacmeibacter sp. MSK16QG-6]
MRAADHPCLSCSLPDCDEADRRCALKQAARAYEAAKRRKDDTAALLPGKRAWLNEFHRDSKYERMGRAPFDAVRDAERIERRAGR